MISCSFDHPAPEFVAEPFSLNILITGIIILLILARRATRDALHGLGSCAFVAQMKMTSPVGYFVQRAKPSICFNPGSFTTRDETYFPMNSHPAPAAPRRDSRDSHKQ